MLPQPKEEDRERLVIQVMQFNFIDSTSHRILYIVLCRVATENSPHRNNECICNQLLPNDALIQ